ncbi:hypothetical protein AKJ09_08461 [Labilithrix luteola]|uniref:Lipoprotein n=1 Tax=Labilithrix luteola TaxID=1391654 RepID=A0A0K1Q7S8_9BACT|nr:hypothetical protein [Labilithrix luteola]AKV01798.1 hypothetical protein AKJ09_08461 [Labilithrix luteola]
MKVRRNTSALRMLVVLGPVAAFALFPAACSSNSEQAAGGECFLATDCAPGLICIEQRDGTRRCSDDLTSVVGKPPGEAGAAATDGGDGEAAAPGDASGGDDAATKPDTSKPDTSTPDTSVPDTSTPDTSTD